MPERAIAFCKMKAKSSIVWRLSLALVLTLAFIVAALGAGPGLPRQYLHAAGGTFGGGTGTPGGPLRD